MSELFDKGRRHDIKNYNMSIAPKLAYMKLTYLEVKEIYEKGINTHSLRSRGTNSLHFTRKKDSKIQKNGTMTVRNIQETHIRPIAFILQRHVNRHETSTKICMYIGRVNPDHYKGNDEHRVRLTNQ